MAKETELKLAIPIQAGTLLREHTALGQAVSFDSKTLQNVYYDTKDLQLNQARVALRIRKAGDRFIQTLKTSGSGSGGLHERGEWEWELSKPELDLSLIDDTLLPAPLNLAELKTTLQPAFETNFTRQRWLLDARHDHLKAEIELVHDQGEVVAQGQKDPISEIELELKSGDTDLLFKVAHDLSDTVPLLISNISKGQRGFRLFAPKKAGLIPDRVPAFDHLHGLIRAAQGELDHFIAARDQLAFNRSWALLEKLYNSLRQLRWCLLHLSRQADTPEELNLPTALRYKLRMFSYSLEHLVTLYQQKVSWERLESCPAALRNCADFALLNEQYQRLMTAPWVGQTLLEVMQWLYLMNREMPERKIIDGESVFQSLLSRVHLPRYPTDKILWLRQLAPLLHLTRWIHYQYPEPALGIQKLQQQATTIQTCILRLSGLMSEEVALIGLQQQEQLKEYEVLLKRNQDDQYEQVLELGRHELSFNSLQQNLKC